MLSRGALVRRFPGEPDSNQEGKWPRGQMVANVAESRLSPRSPSLSWMLILIGVGW
jgi:hypothetical protein